MPDVANDDIEFSELNDKTGEVRRVRTLSRAAIMACPTFILVPWHYREDGTCRHDEPTCEIEGCDQPKLADEIVCRKHGEDMGL